MTIVKGEAIEAAGALPGRTEQGRGASSARTTDTAAVQVPSLLRMILADRHWQSYRTFRVHFVRAAQELAGHEGDPTVRTLDVSERQFHRWTHGARPRPDACRVLESMFGYPIARLIGPVDTSPEGAADSAYPPPAALDGLVSDADSGLVLPSVAAGSTAVQVSVSADAGTAVTVVCQDGAPGRVAVVAGTVRVLIDVSGTDAAGLAPGVVDAPPVTGGARVYSLAERRAR